ncbi:unnamed protein product, partial [Didymodactylos carnosus]
DVPIDLSKPPASASAIVFVSQPSPSLSPTTAIRNALRTMRPPIIEQPVAKRMVLDRQFGQLLTGEQVYKQMKEKEELKSAKAKSTKVISTPVSSTPKRSVNRRRKTKTQVSVADDLMTVTDTPLTFTAAESLITSATATSTSSTLTAVITTDPITTTYTSLVNIRQPSHNEIQFSFASSDAWNNVPGHSNFPRTTTQASILHPYPPAATVTTYSQCTAQPYSATVDPYPLRDMSLNNQLSVP